ncbi:DUF5107 domain-containing protein [Planctomonas sp. JC2975]|uniref:DUF5107 domain-containing protein n=1 Tax=Planctomonas sp. JC2975 TaxID=2729626 RepID=UPI001475D8B7|nr:DUF5107 domain-containing protein [Planctomonas sp. JC2975]NNC13691.1 DUF5107 domain-containing protein [Planctomonas sp. JC2975]
MTAQTTVDPHGPTPPESILERLEAGEAVAWSDELVLPTYEPMTPSRQPLYLDRRVYQGSSGRVYPLPFIERIAQEPTPHAWKAVHLENRCLRVTVLPELGGRIYTGFDKTTGYDFFYRNTVIKPALVGLTGPWISGGVEFNWPQHHRPATYLPMEFDIEEADDGSVTVWCSDHDPFTRMAETHGIRLHPDRSYVEIDVRLHNRTSQRQTFLWWANAAVRVHDRYQSFFPQDVRYVADHARRAITAFPAADRTYYGVDYPARAAREPGADRIDFYANIPAPTSYMVVDSDEAFFGGYDHDVQAGVVHWADRRISPGKKQWTWGDSPFGHAWDRHLTDDDGPYVELMAGVYTDNQPDFSWLMPGEVRRFSQYWYPIPAIGVAHVANRDAALHVDLGTEVEARAAVTRPSHATLRILVDGTSAAEGSRTLHPGEVLRVTADLPDQCSADRVRVELRETTADGSVILADWTVREPADEEPWIATEPPSPESIESVEELYLTGVHLQQYRHPTRSPLPYWREALRRDPGDSRTNLALADLALRAGEYEKAERHARTAVDRVTMRNENPRDAEPYYLLGLILQRLGRSDEAAKWFGKAGWDADWRVPAGIEGALIALRAGDAATALSDADGLAAAGAVDPRIAAVQVVALRRLGDFGGADAVLASATESAPVNDLYCNLADGSVPNDAGLAVDLALDLARLGEIPAAAEALERAAAFPATPAGNMAPVARYLRATLLDRAGDPIGAERARSDARGTDTTWCFPAGLDAHDALTDALAHDPDDDVATELLATLLYDAGRRREALDLWKRALELGADRPLIHRNAGLASYNVLGDEDAAWRHYERARVLAPDDARLLFESDQLAAKLGHPSAERLDRLERDRVLVEQRDDLVVQVAELLTADGRPADALRLIKGRTFQPWEGGEGKALAAWDDARAALGMPVGVPPASLGEARPEATAPSALRADGSTDYFATSLPESLLFAREQEE